MEIGTGTKAYIKLILLKKALESVSFERRSIEENSQNGIEQTS